MVHELAEYLHLVLNDPEGIVACQLSKYIGIIPADRQLGFPYFDIVIGEGRNFFN